MPFPSFVLQMYICSVLFSELQHDFVLIVSLIDSDFRFKLFSFWLWEEIIKNEAKMENNIEYFTQ